MPGVLGQSTQCVQVLLGLCSLNIQDVNYFQIVTLFIQNSLLLNQYIAGIDWQVFENSHCTAFVESHLKLWYIPFGCLGWCCDGHLSSSTSLLGTIRNLLEPIKDCDTFSRQKIAHDLRFVGWGTVVEERPGRIWRIIVHTFPSHSMLCLLFIHCR
jgi:hypothetical protein